MAANPAPELPEGLTLGRFASRMGCSLASVRQAVRNGRLERSLGRRADGAAFIADAALAEREWHANQERQNGRQTAGTIADARKRLLRAQARKHELANRERRRLLVPLREIENRYAAAVVAARTKLLGVPSRVKQRAPDLTLSVLAIIDEQIREALEELAGRDGMTT